MKLTDIVNCKYKKIRIHSYSSTGAEIITLIGGRGITSEEYDYAPRTISSGMAGSIELSIIHPVVGIVEFRFYDTATPREEIFRILKDMDRD